MIDFVRAMAMSLIIVVINPELVHEMEGHWVGSPRWRNLFRTVSFEERTNFGLRLSSILLPFIVVSKLWRTTQAQQDIVDLGNITRRQGYIISFRAMRMGRVGVA